MVPGDIIEVSKGRQQPTILLSHDAYEPYQ